MNAIYDVSTGKKLKHYFIACVSDGITGGVVGYDGIMHCGSAEMIAARFKTKEEAISAAENCPDMVDYKIRYIEE